MVIRINKLFSLAILLVFSVLVSLNFVSAPHVITTSEGGISYSVNEDISNLYNITVNNTDVGQDANITEVKIILYGPFNFTFDSNGTDSGADAFTNTTAVLNWTNSTGYVINGSEAKHFWFNLTATNPGSFEIGVQTFNGTGLANTTNLTVTVNGIVSGCGGALNAPNITYTLNQSIGSGVDGNCITIVNESIILDCAGYNITFGNATGGIGILNMESGVENGYTNITIKNCNIYENSTGFNATAIFFGTDSSSATIFNNTITTQGNETFGMFFGENLTSSNISSNTLVVPGNETVGIIVESGSNISMDSNDITISGILSIGIIFLDGVNDSNVTLNDINISVSDPENTTGIFLSGGSNSNLLYNNNITTSGGGVSIEESTGTNISSNTVISSAFNLSAVHLSNANSSILENNNITTSGNLSTAIILSGLINALVNLNEITTYNDSAVGISFEEATDSNITSNNVTTSGDESRGIHLGADFNDMNVNLNIITISGNDSSGILMGDNSTNGTIFNNTITISGNLSTIDAMGGIFLDVGTSDMNVSSNTITTSGLTTSGIFVWGNESNIDSNTITTSGNYSDGAYMDSAENMNLTSNNITTTGYDAVGIYGKMSSNYMKIFNNRINTSGGIADGIYLYDCSQGNISINNLTGTGGYGIFLNDTTDSLVFNNTISNATDSGIYDYLSSSSNISSNTVHGTKGTGSYVYGIWLENTTLANADSNTLYENDDGGTTSCGGVGGWYANATISSNTVYGDVNDSCARCDGFTFILASGKNSLTLNNNIINSSEGNNSYGIIFTTADGSSTDTITGVGNTIRDSDTCLHFERGNFVFSGANLSNCGTYDISSASNVFATSFNTTVKVINSTINLSQLNISNSDCNISLQEYVRAYVNSTTANLSDATVTLVNNDSAEQQWQKTTTNGYTSYGGATYHFYNGTGYNYSSMTATATKTGYASNSTSSVIGEQSTINITLTATSSDDDDDSTSGRGTTASFWTITHAIDDDQFKAGYTKELAVKNRLRVSIDNEYHYIGVVELTSTTAVINVSSTPQQATLSVGDTRRFDVNDDGYYDIKATLNSIADNKASITILSISEEVTAETEQEESEKEEAAKGEEEIEGEKDMTWLWILIIILILAAAVGSGVAVKKKRKQ